MFLKHQEFLVCNTDHCLSYKPTLYMQYIMFVAKNF